MTLVASLTLLLVRLVVAIAFGFSSFHKLKNLPKSAKQHSLPLPVITFIAVAEAAGTLGLISGVLGQLAAIGLMMVMIGSISFHLFKWKSPYWAEKGGWEYDLMLFTFALVIAVFGVGSLAL